MCGMGRINVLAVAAIVCIFAVAAIAVLMYVRVAPGYGELAQLTEEQIGIIVNNNYPGMRGQLLAGNEPLATSMALSNGNISICGSMESADSISECERNYNLILSYQNKCNELAAIDNSFIDFSSGFCQKVNSLSCDGLEGGTGLLCNSLVMDDVEYCLRMPGGNARGCRNHLNLYKSVKSMNSSLCSQIEDFDVMIECTCIIEGGCSESVDALAKDMIYLDFSAKAGNTSLCEKISYGIVRNLCASGGTLDDMLRI